MAAVFVVTSLATAASHEDVVLKRFGQGGAASSAPRPSPPAWSTASARSKSVIASSLPARRRKRRRPPPRSLTPRRRSPSPLPSPQGARPMAKALSAVSLPSPRSLASPGGSIAPTATPPEDDKDKDTGVPTTRPRAGGEPALRRRRRGDGRRARGRGDRRPQRSALRDPVHRRRRRGVPVGERGRARPRTLTARRRGRRTPTRGRPEDKDSPSAIRARALAAENRRLKAQLAGANEDVARRARPSPRREDEGRQEVDAGARDRDPHVARARSPRCGLEGMLSAMPVIAPVASVNRPPARKTRRRAREPHLQRQEPTAICRWARSTARARRQGPLRPDEDGPRRGEREELIETPGGASPAITATTSSAARNCAWRGLARPQPRL
jgi:hypothetical protein